MSAASPVSSSIPRERAPRTMLLRMRGSVLLSALLLCACGRGGDGVPTWHRDVRSIVVQSCAGCHTAGAIAPFALESYQDVFARRQPGGIIARHLTEEIRENVPALRTLGLL